MRNWLIAGGVVLGLVLVVRKVSYEIDVSGLRNDAALAPLLGSPSGADMGPDSVAWAVSRAATERGFSVPAEAVRVSRKPMRVGLVQIAGAASVRSDKPVPLHDYVIDLTVRRGWFPGVAWPRLVHVETVAPCLGSKGGEATELTWPAGGG